MKRACVAAILAALLLPGLIVAEAQFPYRISKPRAMFGIMEGGAIWYRLINPAATDTDAVHSAYPASALQDTSFAFTAAEDSTLTAGSAYVGYYEVSFSRLVSVTVSAPSVAHAAIAADSVWIYGTNMMGAAISDIYVTDADTPASIAGSKAFASIDSIVIARQDSAGVLVSVGRGLKVGLPMTVPMYTVLGSWQDGTQANLSDTTVGIDATDIEKNTIYNDATPWDGSTDYDFLIWIPPFGDVGGTTKWQ